MSRKVGIGISFDEELLRSIDEKRGYVSRSAYIVSLIQKEIQTTPIHFSPKAGGC